MSQSLRDNPVFQWTVRKMEGPHAFIQWKGTNVCMDCRCICGEGFHVDADFAYEVACPHCKRVYAMSAHIEMREILKGEVYRGCEPIVGQP